MRADPHDSRAPGLLPPSPRWDEFPQPAKSKPKARKSNALRIFVGGGLDREWGHNMLSQYEKYQQEVDGPAEYYTHLQVPSIVRSIEKANAEGMPVDIVGHSYGGTAAFDAASTAGVRGGRVRTLITADPVGYRDVGAVRPSAGSVENWVNINADPPPGFNISDPTARAGGKPSKVPTNYADQDFEVRRRHEDLAGMLRDAGIPNLLEANDQAAIEDGMPTDAWMVQRRSKALNGRQR